MQAHNKKLLIPIFALLFLSTLVYADYDYINHTMIFTASYSENVAFAKGYEVLATVDNFYLTNVTFESTSGATRLRICNNIACVTPIATYAISSGKVDFGLSTINITKGHNVSIIWDASGGTWASKYMAVGTRKTPQNFSTFNISNGIYNGAYNTEWHDLIAIGTQNGTVSTVTSPFILVSQVPSDINTKTLFQYPSINITYNYTVLTGLSQAILNYSVILTKQTCLYLLNGTCITQNKTYITTPQSSNFTSGTTALISYLLTENYLLPYNANLPQSNFSNIKHNLSTATNNNEYHAIQFQNLSNETPYVLLEAMINTSGLARIYYCNSSYDFSSNIIVSSSCAEAAQFSTATYNHSHNANSSHQVFTFSLTNGKLAGITFTNTSYFMIRRSTGTLDLYHIPIVAKSNTFQYSQNNGNSWVNRDYTLDAHIHQYSNTDYLSYNACGNYSGTVNCSTTFQNDTYNVYLLPPTPPTITNPNSSTIASAFMNITFLNATAQQPEASIYFYNITLLDSTGTFNRTIQSNNSLNNSYYWNVLNASLPIGEWFVKVTAQDSNNETAFDFESFNITTNALLNITALTALGSSPILNFTINLTDLTTSTTTTKNTTTGLVQFDTIIGRNYTAIIDAPGYALNDTAATRNWTQNSTYNNFSFYLYGNNSVRVFIYDETTNALLNGFNITIVITGNSTSNTYNTTNGTFYISDLLDGTYSFSFSGGVYTLKSYSVTVGSRSSQTLNAYLSTSAQTVIFTIGNSLTGETIEGANFVVIKLVNSSYIVTDTKTSDITGRVQITYILLNKYCFTITATNFISKYFCLDPILFASYNVNMDPSIGPSNNQSLEGLSVAYYPTLFYNTAQNNFTFTIASPGGILETYNYSLTYPNGTGTTKTITGGGNNANGGTFIFNFTIQNATLQDKVVFNYSYDNIYLSKPNNFSYSYNIVLQGTNYTWIDLKENLPSYGLGSLEKILIVTLALIIIVGLGYGLGGTPAGAVMGMLTLGFFSFIGFVPLLTIIPTLIIGFLLLRGST